MGMAYADNHILVAFGGTLYGGTEIWQTGFRMRSNNVVPSTDWLAWNPGGLNAIQALINTYWSTANLMGTQTKLTYCKVNVIGTDGHYLDKANSFEKVYSPAIAGTGTMNLPSHVAVVASLRTDAARGRAHAGRMYLPVLSGSVDVSTGLLGGTANDVVRDQLATFLSATKTVPGPAASSGIQPAVMSSLGTGPLHNVTGVWVGKVYDTQRRRRSALIESYDAIKPV